MEDGDGSLLDDEDDAAAVVVGEDRGDDRLCGLAWRDGCCAVLL